MSTKFDDNVAMDIPKTKDSIEPELPWKISEEEIGTSSAKDAKMSRNAGAAMPLQVRGIFVALLIVTIFVAVLNSFVDIAVDNMNMQSDISEQERRAIEIKNKFEKVSSEKIALSQDADKLAQDIKDLSAQKELYAAVIETLTKKSDDVQSDN